MKLEKQYGGLALMFVGASLLIVCHLAGWKSNLELLIGLILIILGYIIYLWLQKREEKY